MATNNSVEESTRHYLDEQDGKRYKWVNAFNKAIDRIFTGRGNQSNPPVQNSILIWGHDPTPDQRLSLDEETTSIICQLPQSIGSMLHLESPSATGPMVETSLSNNAFAKGLHFFHIMGHGEPNGGIHVPCGQRYAWPGHQFVEHLALWSKNRPIKGAFFNACYSDIALAKTAAQKWGIAIGVSNRVDSKTAALFATTFYRVYFNSQPNVRDAFEVAKSSLSGHKCRKVRVNVERFALFP